MKDYISKEEILSRLFNACNERNTAVEEAYTGKSVRTAHCEKLTAQISVYEELLTSMNYEVNFIRSFLENKFHYIICGVSLKDKETGEEELYGTSYINIREIVITFEENETIRMYYNVKTDMYWIGSVNWDLFKEFKGIENETAFEAYGRIINQLDQMHPRREALNRICKHLLCSVTQNTYKEERFDNIVKSVLKDMVADYNAQMYTVKPSNESNFTDMMDLCEILERRNIVCRVDEKEKINPQNGEPWYYVELTEGE